MSLSYKHLSSELTPIILSAGDIIMRYYKTNFNIEHKEDSSPVTIADQQAERFIIEKIKKLTPNIPIVAEETTSMGHIPDIKGDYFWLVDPLDGTREFIDEADEFTVNIALIMDDKPVLGVVYAPAIDELYVGYDDTAYITKDNVEKPISVRPFPDIGITAVASKRHGNIDEMNNFLSDIKIANFVTRGSSLKFCLIANGQADIYPRFGPTYEWDTAAGDAILRAARGMTYTRNGNILTYRKADFWNKEFIASSKPFK